MGKMLSKIDSLPTKMKENQIFFLMFHGFKGSCQFIKKGNNSKVFLGSFYALPPPPFVLCGQIVNMKKIYVSSLIVPMVGGSNQSAVFGSLRCTWSSFCSSASWALIVNSFTEQY